MSSYNSFFSCSWVLSLIMACAYWVLIHLNGISLTWLPSCQGKLIDANIINI